MNELGETLSSVAQAVGVAMTQVKTWRLGQQTTGSVDAVVRRKMEATELQQLRRDNKRLQEENEIPRKASACMGLYVWNVFPFESSTFLPLC
jgi:transposase